ncbi:unnamed protein product [Lepeophtheirus salmonis]|uniref:(salmon louse) hypothetical protein n=1 Tax=Lepeophtheirus salmonis TaxID=72036 RepID=A0A7R8D2Y1_LEPSM|nr:unnamed protein product [Lepeophtheirus salmonis]CAF3010339.1 unnamed protein product [Lepeophtheirus salmonis]
MYLGMMLVMEGLALFIPSYLMKNLSALKGKAHSPMYTLFLSGRVIVEVDEDMPVLGLFFHVVGEGVVNMARTAKDAASDKENYIDFRLRLLGKPGKHGWVQYFCKAALREDNGLTHKNQQVFIIMNPIDLNLEPPILSQPFHCEIIHNIGVKCCSSGPVTCRVRLDRGGYVPGEAISIWAKIENDRRQCSIKSITSIFN